MGLVGALAATATPPLAAWSARIDVDILGLVTAAAVAAVLVGGVLGGWVTHALSRPRAASRGLDVGTLRLEAGMRVVSGEQPGLGARWRHGRAVLEPGSITLRPYRWGVSLLPQEPVRVDITAIDRDGVRRNPWRNAFSVSPSALLVQVTTATGAELEVAVLGRSAVRALDVVVPPPEVGR